MTKAAHQNPGQDAMNSLYIRMMPKLWSDPNIISNSYYSVSGHKKTVKQTYLTPCKPHEKIVNHKQVKTYNKQIQNDYRIVWYSLITNVQDVRECPF